LLFTLLNSHCARCYAVPSHRHNCIITSCVSKDETGDNFTMWGEDCTVYMDTQYPSKILNGLWCAQLCGLDNSSDIFLVGPTWRRWELKIRGVSGWQLEFSAVPPGKNFIRTTPVSIWKRKLRFFQQTEHPAPLPWGHCMVPYHSLPIGFRCKMVGPNFMSRNILIKSPQHQWLLLQKIRSNYFSSLCASLSICGNQYTQNLE